MYTLENAVNDNYGSMVCYLKSHNIYDDDIFHDTIVSCYKVFENRIIHKENVFKYFLSSYKMNLLRNKEYAYHRKTDDMPCDYDVIADLSEAGTTMDYLKLRFFFFKNFGVENTILYRRYCLGGYSIKELEEESQQKGLHYLFKKMYNAARKEFADMVKDFE